jgi:hypothetical protein
MNSWYFGTLVKIDVSSIPSVPYSDQRNTVTPCYQERIKRRLSMQHHAVARDVCMLNSIVADPRSEQLFSLSIVA